MKTLVVLSSAVLVALFFLPFCVKAQDNVQTSEIVTLKSQYDELQRRTRIYEGFRAIREDMFQEIRRQSLDSLAQAMQKVIQKETELNKLSEENRQLLAKAEEAQASLIKAVSDRDSIYFLGKPVGKTFYNILVWSIIGLLLAISFIMLLLLKNAIQISKKRLDDYHHLLDEYETYRKTSRERLERATIDHFNEIKKLKGL